MGTFPVPQTTCVIRQMFVPMQPSVHIGAGHTMMTAAFIAKLSPVSPLGHRQTACSVFIIPPPCVLQDCSHRGGAGEAADEQ